MSFNESFFAALAFVLLFALIGKSVYPALIGKLDSKIIKIKNDIDEAAQMYREAEEYLDNCKKLHQDAQIQSKAIIEHAEKECERLHHLALEKIDELRINEEKYLQDRILLLERQAIADIKKKAVDIALLASEKIIFDSMSADKDAEYLDSVMKKISLGA
jgi:F-type H+-transporting ATPase subunit b